jgi:hypothetical protein
MLFLKAFLYAIFWIVVFCGVIALMVFIGHLGIQLFGYVFIPICLGLFMVFCVTMAIYQTMKAEQK